MQNERIFAAKVRIDRGGYEMGSGRYWGLQLGGFALYRVTRAERVAYIRAKSRADAIAEFCNS